MTTEGQLQKVPAPQTRPPQGSVLISLLWGLSGVLIGVVLGAAGVGHSLLQQFTPNGNHVHELGQLNGRVEDLRKDLGQRERELAAERQDRKEAIGVLKLALDASERNTQAANLKGEFLSRLLALERGRSLPNQAQFVDVVCTLRAQRPASGAVFATGPLELSAQELRGGVKPEVAQLLMQNGATADLLGRASRAADAQPLPPVTAFNVTEVQRAAQVRRSAMREAHEAIAALQRVAEPIQIARTVKFGDGSEFPLAREVGIALRLRKDCGAP